jgi:hypothetical protein
MCNSICAFVLLWNATWSVVFTRCCLRWLNYVNWCVIVGPWNQRMWKSLFTKKGRGLFAKEPSPFIARVYLHYVSLVSQFFFYLNLEAVSFFISPRSSLFQSYHYYILYLLKLFLENADVLFQCQSQFSRWLCQGGASWNPCSHATCWLLLIFISDDHFLPKNRRTWSNQLFCFPFVTKEITAEGPKIPRCSNSV